MRGWTGCSAVIRRLLGAVACASAVACGGCGEMREMHRLREREELIAEMRMILTPEIQQALLEEAKAWRLHGDKSAPVARGIVEGPRCGMVILGEDGSFTLAWPRRRINGRGLRWFQCVKLLVHPDTSSHTQPPAGRIEAQFFGEAEGAWGPPVPLEKVLKDGV